MSGLFSTFNTAVKGLNAQQTALSTSSNNISNANTEGYSRQRVDLKEDITYEIAGVGRIGTGVKIEDVVRTVDGLVDYQIRNENSTLNQYTAKSDVMSQLEAVFNEPSDSGVNATVGEMFNAWQQLSNNPESSGAKSVVVEKSKTLADNVNQMAAQLGQLKDDTVSNLEKNVFDVNSTVEQLKTVNDQIFNIAIKGESPNNLLDQRDLLMKQMSGLADCTGSFDKWGRANVTLGGKDITAKDASYTLSTVRELDDNGDGTWTARIAVGGDTAGLKDIQLSATDAANILAGSPVYYTEGSPGSIVTADITSGKIGGCLSALNEIDARMTDLNSFTTEMARMVNKAYNPENTAGKDFFAFADETNKNAMDFMVNKDIQDDESLVSTGTGSSSAAGDGSKALAVANLRNSTDTASGGTLEGSYSKIVTKVGVSTEYASNMVKTHEAVMEQLQNRRDSVSGVSIDEEVTNIIQYQRSFEANSRVINVLSEMLDTLINKTGA
jgi:flagellar hook-associated protein 1